MNNKDFTLIIHSCDKFSDLWDAHVTLLNRNWPDRNCPTFILTDSPTDRELENVKVLSAGEGKEITERIKYALDHIDTKYVVVTLDDYFPIYPIQSKRIERLLEIMENESYDYMRLYYRPKSGKIPTHYKDIYDLDLNGGYRVNLYVGIWTKDFMSRTLGDKVLNAWDFEVSLTENARNTNGHCAVSLGNEFQILDVVRKGRILPKAAKYFKKHKIYHGNRPNIPLFSYFLLGIKQNGGIVASKFPKPVYRLIKRICISLGMVSYSAKNTKNG